MKSNWLALFASSVTLIILTGVIAVIVIQTGNSQFYSKPDGGQTEQTEKKIGAQGAETTQPIAGNTTITNKPLETMNYAAEATTSKEIISQTESTRPRPAVTVKPSEATGLSSVKPSATTADKFISADQIRKIVLDRIHTTNLRVIETQLEKAEYPPRYEIKLVDDKYQYEVKVHAITGLVIEIEKKGIEKNEEDD